jgi:hypothetical protein
VVRHGDPMIGAGGRRTAATKVCVCIGSPGTKGEHSLLEVNMARHNNTVSLRIKTPVCWVTQENACHRARHDFDCEVWITQAPKHPKVIVGRIMVEEELVGCGVIAQAASMAVKCVGGCGERLRPVSGRNGSVK